MALWEEKEEAEEGGWKEGGWEEGRARARNCCSRRFRGARSRPFPIERATYHHHQQQKEEEEEEEEEKEQKEQQQQQWQQ